MPTRSNMNPTTIDWPKDRNSRVEASSHRHRIVVFVNTRLLRALSSSLVGPPTRRPSVVQQSETDSASQIPRLHSPSFGDVCAAARPRNIRSKDVLPISLVGAYVVEEA